MRRHSRTVSSFSTASAQVTNLLIVAGVRSAQAFLTYSFSVFLQEWRSQVQGIPSCMSEYILSMVAILTRVYSTRSSSNICLFIESNIAALSSWFSVRGTAYIFISFTVCMTSLGTSLSSCCLLNCILMSLNFCRAAVIQRNPNNFCI